MSQPNYPHPDSVEHEFVLNSKNLREVLDWVYLHDNEREYTSYSYGHFHCDTPGVKDAFRGFRLYISDDELALLFNITFSDKLYRNYSRKEYADVKENRF